MCFNVFTADDECERERLKKRQLWLVWYTVSCLAAHFGGFTKTCGCKSDRAVKMNHFELQHVSVYVKCVDLRAETFMPSGSYVCIHVAVDAYCSSLRAHVPLVVPNPRLLLTEMLVGCSVWLSFIERLHRLKRWLPWRQIQNHSPAFYVSLSSSISAQCVKNNFPSIHWHGRVDRTLCYCYWARTATQMDELINLDSLGSSKTIGRAKDACERAARVNHLII